MKKLARRPIDILKATKTTGDLIKAFRANFQIKLGDMAHACKISQVNFSARERSRREVGPRVALKRFASLTPVAAKGRS